MKTDDWPDWAPGLAALQEARNRIEYAIMANQQAGFDRPDLRGRLEDANEAIVEYTGDKEDRDNEQIAAGICSISVKDYRRAMAREEETK